MLKPGLPVRYQVSAAIDAVKLEEHPGSSLKSPTKTLVKVPPKAIVEQDGAVAPSGLVNILWAGDAFSVYYEDLKTNAQIVETAT